jgi:hypothetical protein
MKPNAAAAPQSRRQFLRRLAGATVALGVPAARANPPAGAGPAGWEEIGRRRCGVAEPRRLAVGPDDTIHAAAGTQVVRWTEAGARPLLELGEPVRCAGVAPDGALLAGLRNRIVIFDAEGRRRAEWAVPGARAWLTGLCVTADEVLAADSGGRVVWRFDRAGKVLGRIGARDAAGGDPGLVLPGPFLDVRLHPDGLLRVNNPGRHRIEAYTIAGGRVQAWGEPTSAPSGFCGCCNPIGLAVLPDGRIVTAEKGLPRVKVYGADGTFESVVAGTERFAENARRSSDPAGGRSGGLDVATDARGRIHVLDRVTGDVRTFQPRRRA